MLKINANSNLVFTPKMENKGNGEKEIKKETTIYKPSAPQPADVVDIDNPSTPL